MQRRFTAQCRWHIVSSIIKALGSYVVFSVKVYHKVIWICCDNTAVVVRQSAARVQMVVERCTIVGLHQSIEREWHKMKVAYLYYMIEMFAYCWRTLRRVVV